MLVLTISLHNHVIEWSSSRYPTVSVESPWFFGTIKSVDCDRIFRFVLEYERGGVSVRVANL